MRCRFLGLSLLMALHPLVAQQRPEVDDSRKSAPTVNAPPKPGKASSAPPVGLPPGVTQEQYDAYMKSQGKAAGGKSGGGKSKAGKSAGKMPALAPPVLNLPKAFDLGSYAIATTKFLAEGGRVNVWRADYSMPNDYELKQFQKSGAMDPRLLSRMKILKIMGTNKFGGQKRTEFFNLFLVQGPGVLKGVLTINGKEIQDAEIKTLNGMECAQFTFGNHVVVIHPNREPEKFFENLAWVYSQASIINGWSASGVVPRSRDGILALGMSKLEAVGLFRFPFSEVVIAMKGVRFGNEVWLESEQPRAINVTSQDRDVSPYGFMLGLERPQPLWIKIKLGEARSIDLGFMPKNGYRPLDLDIAGDIHSAASPSLSATSSKIKDSIPLMEAFKVKFNTPSWRVDEDAESFTGQADKAYAETGFPIALFNIVDPLGYSKERSQVRDFVGPIVRKARQMKVEVVWDKYPRKH